MIRSAQAPAVRAALDTMRSGGYKVAVKAALIKHLLRAR